jgi:hypothetical protein
MQAFWQINNRKMKYTILLVFFLTLICCSVLAQENSTNSGSEDTIFDAISHECPPPLIVRTGLAKDDTQQLCLNNCCLACPFADNFYQENKIKITYQVFASVGIVSFVLMIILSIFFVTLPSQKQNPLSKRVLLPLALGVMYFEGSEFFTISQKSLVNNEKY